ncbi:MAG: PH domain-containing protein [Actinomycetota bacterium]
MLLLIGLRTSLSISDEGLLVVNPLRTFRVPWSAVQGLESGWVLRVRTGDRLIGVTAVEASNASLTTGAWQTRPQRVKAELEQRFGDRFGTGPPGRVQVSYRGAVWVIVGVWAVWIPVVLLRWAGIL